MSYRAPAQEKCHACGKTVYAMEMMKADNLVFHKQCMKCTECSKALSLGNYAALEGKYYCKPHFKQLFALKGNYSEGFGEEQHKMKWLRKDGEDGSGELSPAANVEQEPDPVRGDVVKSGSNVGAAKEAAEVVGGASPAALRGRFEQTATTDSPPPGSPGGSRSSPFTVRRDKCVVCNKTVYDMEKMVADEKIFHKTCMKCEHCGKTLSLGNYAALQGKYYCKPHFKQLFATKGNYSEGFGEEDHKKKWLKDGDKEEAVKNASSSIGALEDFVDDQAVPEPEQAEEAEPEQAAEPEAEADAEAEAEAEAAQEADESEDA